MSDLVERLRRGEPCIECCDDRCKVMDTRSGCTCAEAADEITRLTAEMERLKQVISERHAEVEALVGDYNTARDAHDDRVRENARLTARVEELEAALRAAYEVFAGSDGFIPETCAEGYQQQIIKQMVDCISAALSHPEKGGE